MYPKIVAAYSRRYEPQWLIDELEENLKWCDDIVCYDDRGRDPDDLDWNENLRYTTLHRMAGEKGASHVIMIAPDERLADNSEQVLKQAIDEYPGQFFVVKVLELYEPKKYRSDGQWGQFKQSRIYPWLPGQQFMDRPLHNSGCPYMPSLEYLTYIDLYLYHLKPIVRENPARRVAAYKAIDPDELCSDHVAYDWIVDDSTLELTDIPVGYTPEHEGRYEWKP